MPPAIIPAVAAIAGGVASGAGSAAGGKKAGDAANKQLALQQQQLQFGRGLAQQGMSQAWAPAANYWNTLLSGNPTAVQGAIGPISEQMRGQSGAGIRNLSSSLPAGGERNLAIAEATNKQYGDLARLYAGVQPQAAGALGQLSQIPLNAGASVMGQGAPQVGAGLGAQAYGQGLAAQGMQGAGNLIYQGLHKGQQAGVGKGSGSQGTVVPGGTGKES